MSIYEVTALGLALGAGLFAGAAHLRLRLRQRRHSEHEDYWERARWERVRSIIEPALVELVGATVVLTTSYKVPSEETGQVLCAWLSERWRDFVAVERDTSTTQPEWRVVVTSETIEVSPLLSRQWLFRMRLVSSSTGHRMVGFGFHLGGGPPLPSAHLTSTS